MKDESADVSCRLATLRRSVCLRTLLRSVAKPLLVHPSSFDLPTGGFMAARPGSDKTILIVEDDVLLRDCLALMLEMSGCQVAVASNGQEALEHLHGQPLPSLIVLDL